jgi:hypothetical protein
MMVKVRAGSPFKATEQNCLKGDGWREQRIESIQNSLCLSPKTAVQ